jgi:small-conductance mechanosensitive channel
MTGSFMEWLESDVQIFALSFMAILYIIKIALLMRQRLAREVAPAKGSAGIGVAQSMFNVLMPWSMESTRKKPLFCIEFAFFHIAVALAIAATFIFPYAPQWLTPTVRMIFSLFIGIGLVVGVKRFLRRLLDPTMRAISTLDDFFSIAILDLFFITAVYALMTNHAFAVIVFFIMTTFFLMYVPFSKISHYLYYPFGRYLRSGGSNT